MDKLTIEHLAPYLPYGLKVEILNYKCDYTGIRYSQMTYVVLDQCFDVAIGYQGGYVFKYKPILRPLSDYKDVNSKAMSDLNCDLSSQIQISDFANKKIGISDLSYTNACVLFQNHVDIFGLIDNDLAVDINTIEV